MRVLTGGAIGRSRAAIACLAIGAILIGAAAIWFLVEALLGSGAAVALAATPEPTVRPGSDIRGGGAAGFVGTPLLARRRRARRSGSSPSWRPSPTSA